MNSVTQIRGSVFAVVAMMISLMAGGQSLAVTTDVSAKIVKLLVKHRARAGSDVLVSETDFYDSDTHLSLPLALVLKEQLVTALRANGFRLVRPSKDVSTAWVVQCRWTQKGDKLSVTFLANPWKEWKRGKVSVSSQVVERRRFAPELFKPDMASFSRTLLHRLALNDHLTKPHSVYLKPLVVNGAVGGQSANRYFNHWLSNAVKNSNLLLPIDTKAVLAKIPTATIRTRGFRPVAKTKPGTSLTADLLASQSQLSGKVHFNMQTVKVNVELMDESGRAISSALVDVPIETLPAMIAEDLRNAEQAEQTFNQNGLVLDFSTTRGEGETLYRENETIKFLLRVNKPAYVYLFNLDVQGNAVLLYPNPELGAPVEKVTANEVLVLPDDALPYEIIVVPPFGQDVAWAVAAEEKLNIPDALQGAWAQSKTLQQRVRQMGRAATQGYAETRIFVTTTK